MPSRGCHPRSGCTFWVFSFFILLNYSINDQPATQGNNTKVCDYMNNHSNLPVFQFSVRLWFEFLMLIILPHPIQCLCAIPLFMPQGHELSLVINPARKHGDISGECSIHSLDSFIANRPQTLNTNRTNIAYNHIFHFSLNLFAPSLSVILVIFHGLSDTKSLRIAISQDMIYHGDPIILLHS